MKVDPTSEICELVADALDIGVDEVRESPDLQSVEGWDSLRQLNVMLALEETFDVVLAPEDIKELTSIDRIAHLVIERRAK